MTAQVYAGGVWRPTSGCQVYAGGAWRTIKTVQVYSGGAWRVVANYVPPMGAPTISPSPFFRGSSSYSATSTGITATPVGGAAPYTYAWSVLSSTPTTVTINSPALASTTVSADLSSGNVTCTLRCIITDALGSSNYADVDGEFDYHAPTGGGGGGGILP